MINQPDNPNQPRYQPPNSYGPPQNEPIYAWPGSDGTNNAQPISGEPGYVNYNLPPVTPIPPGSMPYLNPLTLDPQAELYRLAAKRADAKLRFYKHLRSYVTVNVLLWGIAIISEFGNWGHGSIWSFTWPIWVTLFWGIGLVSEYVNVFLVNDQRKQDMIEAEMRRMRR